MKCEGRKSAKEIKIEDVGEMEKYFRCKFNLNRHRDQQNLHNQL